MFDIEDFLKRNGLVCRRRIGPDPNHFGDTFAEYADAKVGVRIATDRGELDVKISRADDQSNTWFGIAEIQRLFVDHAYGLIDIEESVSFLEDHWQEIINRFTLDRWEDTKSKLDHLRQDFQNRLLTNWPGAISNFGSFLTSKGLSCQNRHDETTPHGGKIQSIQYANANIGIRIISDEEGRQIQIADAASRPETWYDIRLIRRLLYDDKSYEMLSADKFAFIQDKWAEIVDYFDVTNSEETHQRLDELQRKIASKKHLKLPSLTIKGEALRLNLNKP